MSFFHSNFSSDDIADFLDISPCRNDNDAERQSRQRVDIKENGTLQVGEARMVSKNLKRGQYSIKVRSTNSRRLGARIVVEVRDRKGDSEETDDRELVLFERSMNIKTSFLAPSSYTTDNLAIHQNSVMKVKLSNPSENHSVHFSVELNGFFYVKRRRHTASSSRPISNPNMSSGHSRCASFGGDIHLQNPVDADQEEKKQQRRMQELSISPNRELRPIPSSPGTPPTPEPLRRLKVRWIPREDGAIGRGGTSHVFMGVADDGRYVAIKQIHINNQADSDKLQKEVELLRRCRHPHIVRYLGSSVGDDSHERRYLTIFLEFIQGGSLHDILRKVGALFEQIASNYTQQILYGLAYLHSQGIVHGDIKPSNVLVTHLQTTVKISDFGASRYLEDQVGDTTEGTPLYMSPEIIRGEPSTPQSDIWALGCTVLEMLTSQAPWSECNFQDIFDAFRHIRSTTTPPVIPDFVSPPAADFVRQCCEINPENRPNAEELLCHGFIRDHDHWLQEHEGWVSQHPQQAAGPTTPTADCIPTDTGSSFEFTAHSVVTDFTDTGTYSEQENTSAGKPELMEMGDTAEPCPDTKPVFSAFMQHEAFLDLDDNELDVYPAAVTPQTESKHLSFKEDEIDSGFDEKQDKETHNEDQGSDWSMDSISDDSSVAISTSLGDSDGSDLGFEVITDGEVANACEAQKQDTLKREDSQRRISVFLRRNAQRQKLLSKSILGLSSVEYDDIIP